MTADRWTKKEYQAAMALCAELPLIECRLADLGLFETMHAVNAATRKIGYEVERRIRRGYTHDR